MSWQPKWEEVESHRQERYEESVCLQMLKLLHATKREQEIREADPLGMDQLTLTALTGVLEIPMTLASEKIPYLHDLDRDLRERPTKTVLFQRFSDMLDAAPSTAAVGLIFQWPQTGRFFVLHNLPNCPQTSKFGRFWQFGRRRYWLQSLLDTVRELQLVATEDEEAE